MRWELSSRGRLKAERDSRLLAVLLKLLPSITAFTTLPTQTTIVTASKHAITNLRFIPKPLLDITPSASMDLPPTSDFRRAGGSGLNSLDAPVPL